MPKNWFLKINKTKYTLNIFITKENINNNEKFKTGFSLKVIKRISKIKNEIPSKYAENFISNILNNKEKKITRKPKKLKINILKTFAIRSKDQSKIIHYLLLANDKTDTLFIMWFESPPKLWKENWKIGNVILNNIQIDGKI